MRLLKSKDIRLHRGSEQLDVEEKTKRNFVAKYEWSKKRQSERHVLRKEMAVHAIPSCSSVRSQKKAQTALIVHYAGRTSVSSVSGAKESEIWRNISRKSHYFKDRRNRPTGS